MAYLQSLTLGFGYELKIIPSLLSFLFYQKNNGFIVSCFDSYYMRTINRCLDGEMEHFTSSLRRRFEKSNISHVPCGITPSKIFFGYGRRKTSKAGLVP